MAVVKIDSEERATVNFGYHNRAADSEQREADAGYRNRTMLLRSEKQAKNFGNRNRRKDDMYLCETCRKGQVEMCPYFKEHFLESGTAVRKCPEYEEEIENDCIGEGRGSCAEESI